ncbi:MAG: hypothetical protein R3D58_13730 [Saprospiraceae bacterium]
MYIRLRIISPACSRLDVGIKFKQLALYLLENGVDVESAMRHFRHTSLEMFQRYVKRLGVVNEQIRELKIDLPS